MTPIEASSDERARYAAESLACAEYEQEYRYVWE
jgi:hypothetical protein